MSEAKSERDQILEVLRSGKGVMLGGKVVTSVENLPSEAELAAMNPALAGKTAESLEAQIKKLQDDLKSVKEVEARNKAAASAEAKSEEKSEASSEAKPKSSAEATKSHEAAKGESKGK